MGLVGREPGLVRRPARRWMLGCLQIFFRDNPALVPRPIAATPAGLLRVALSLLLPAGAGGLLGDSPLLPALPPASDPLRGLGADRAAAALSGGAADDLGASAPGLAAPVLGHVLRERGQRAARALDARPAAAEALASRSRRRESSRRSAASTGVPRDGPCFSGASRRLPSPRALWEFHRFGIERDAYFFNLAWAGYNLLFLLGALMLAWERPQRRERGARRGASSRSGSISTASGSTARTAGRELSTAARSCWTSRDSLPDALRARARTTASACARRSCITSASRGDSASACASSTRRRRRAMRCCSECSRMRRLGNASRARAPQQRSPPRRSSCSPSRGYFRPLRRRRRHHPRRRRASPLRLLKGETERTVFLRDRSPRGLGLVCPGSRPPVDGLWRISGLGGSVGWGRVAYARRRLPFLWYVGIELVGEPQDSRDPECELAA